VLGRLTALTALLIVPLFAQERTPSLSGIVVAARDGKPVKRAEVILRPAAPGTAPIGVTTDENGRFAFFNVRAGRYNLYATRDGLLPSTYALYRDARLPLPFTFSEKQPLDSLILRLPPAGVLSGKVLHHDGELASGVIVEAYRGFYDRARYLYETAGRAITNDRGEYRMYNLPPGKYYLAALVTAFRDAPPNLDESFPVDEAGTRIAPLRSVTTFYSTAWKLTEAAQFYLAGGAEISTMDITLARTKAGTVVGRAVSARSGLPVQGATVILVRPDAQEAGFLTARFQTKPLQDGTFEIRGVVPGTYFIEVSASEERKPLRARQLLMVTDDREVKVEVLLRGEVTVEGSVRTESKTPVRFDALQLTAEPRLAVGSKTVRVKPDGSFSVTLLPGVVYNLILTNAPDNVYLKGAQLESVDVLERGLTLMESTILPLDVIVDTAGAQVRGWSQPGANLLLMPDDGRLEKYQSALANEYGIFGFRGVAPGDYRVLSWFDTPPCEVHDPASRAACSAFGAKVSVSEGGDRTLEVEPSDKAEVRVTSGQ
jgi:hypothetical protein